MVRPSMSVQIFVHVARPWDAGDVDALGLEDGAHQTRDDDDGLDGRDGGKYDEKDQSGFHFIFIFLVNEEGLQKS